MNHLVLRGDFVRDLFDFRRDFDEIFKRMLTGKPWGQEQVALSNPFNFVPAVESFIDKEAKKYVCRVHIPGVDPKELQVSVQNNVLIIRGERKTTRTGKEIEPFEREINYGAFERTLPLPEGLNTDKLAAEYAHGVLEITAPVAAVALPRKIEIKTLPTAKAVAA
jgi:HSP20 family protein